MDQAARLPTCVGADGLTEVRFETVGAFTSGWDISHSRGPAGARAVFAGRPAAA